MKHRELQRFLVEDINRGDITSELLSNKQINARIIARQNGIVAGTKYVKALFVAKKCRVQVIRKDGQNIQANQTVLQIEGPVKSILSCERTALNLLSRMSGIATSTNQLVKKVKKISKKTDVYSTRKTAPGLRFFDKEAVEIGGGRKHRITLSDMIMIKDNHIAAEGSIVELIKRARKKAKLFEVEVDTFADAILAATLGVPIIMLDNFSPEMIKRTIKELEKMHLRKKIRLEASGGINIKNIQDYAKTGVDMISVGSITNSAPAVDFSLEV
ncbi:MAG: carboxylating nicotinate-nucleotide diphosphorylase [Candidatus Nitrosotenuis sp.]